MASTSVSQSICPLCREPELERRETRARCAACGCRIEIDAGMRGARFTRIPEDYADIASALLGAWMTRRAMFEAVDSALAEQRPDDDANDAEWDEHEAFDDGAVPVRPWLLPLSALVGLLVLGCLLSGVLGIGAVYWSTRPQPEKETLANVGEQVGLDGAVLTGTLPFTTSAIPVSTTVPATDIQESTQPVPELPIAAPPTEVAPALDSPLPSPPPVPTRPQSTLTPPTLPPPTATFPPTALPTALPTRTPPPTFTAVVQATLPLTPTSTPVLATSTSTALAATATISTPRTATPVPTATATLTPTATPQAGSTILIGTIRINTISNRGSLPSQFDEYVEIQNIGSNPVELGDFVLRHLIPGRDPAAPPGDFELAQANILLANQVLRVYTNQLRSSGVIPSYNWEYAPGNLWPDNPTQRVSVLLVNVKEGREYARFSY